MSNWFTEQWKQIRGNLKYELVRQVFLTLGGATLIATVGAVLQSVFSNVDKIWFVFGGLFVFSCLIFILGLRRPNEHSGQEGTAPQTATIAERDKPTVDPVHVEILEVLFSGAPFDTNCRILMNLRITNRNSDEFVITNWELTVLINGFGVRHAAHHRPVPESWFIKRQGRGSELGHRFNPGDLLPRFEKGMPIAGWILFEYYTAEACSFPYNAGFKISMRDSLGHEHVGMKPPAAYVWTGDIQSR